MRNALAYFAIFALVVAALMLGLGLVAPSLLPDVQDRGQFVYLVLLLSLIGTGVFGSSRAHIGVALKQGLVWAGILLFLVALYSFRGDFSKIGKTVVAELVPARAQAVRDETPGGNGGAVALRKAADGHFWADGRVGKAHVRFMVDTGASTVALTALDARRAGLDLKALRYVVPVSTASGQVMAAPVTLKSVSIGGLKVNNVRALVMREGLGTSLLGMSYLGRLSRFEASRNQLILRR